MSQGPNSHRLFIERVVIALALVAVALLLWNLRGLFLLVFGSVLVSVILGMVAEPIRRRLGVPPALALLAAVLIVSGVIGTAFWLFGAEVIRQATSLRELIPAAWAALETRLDAWGLGEALREWSDTLAQGGGVVSNLGTIAVSIGNGLADTVLVIVGGIYLAAQPALYRVGLLKLVPERGRALAAEALDASGRALHLWLLGRMVSMTVVGLLTWLGLTIIGVPSALTLALLAALLEFVPFIGPIISAVPAILLGFAAGPEKALWVALLFTALLGLANATQISLSNERSCVMRDDYAILCWGGAGTDYGTTTDSLIMTYYYRVPQLVDLLELLTQNGQLLGPTPSPGTQPTPAPSPTPEPSPTPSPRPSPRGRSGVSAQPSE